MDLVESYRQDLRFAPGRVTRVLLGATVLLAAVLPLAGPPAWTVRGILIAITAIGVLGQNLLIGYAGQISFGQAGFLAIGAYCCLLGVEAMAVEKAVVKISPTDPQTATREVMPPDWAPWSLLGTGAVVVLYSFSVPQKISGA